ncbi:hypothetical protein DM01DRAFT_1315286 [Hesseltinella vesiculosa]|uniref:Tc1-like transposase DDE domain-containing protein n=1 Tax=Hesseltinella vesiculosa TaxID=101127 RepID=A0A1X2GVD8_9FUNG|nr:hypothetical protein DM01DRAFT_1315286 [Hesseltinella vesiculosa]
MKRGKIVANLNHNEISSIAQYLYVNPDRCMHLPTYSPELDPIEQFWSAASSKRRVMMFLSRICMALSVILLPASMTASIGPLCSCI